MREVDGGGTWISRALMPTDRLPSLLRLPAAA